MKSIFVDINEFTFDPIYSNYIEKSCFEANKD